VQKKTSLAASSLGSDAAVRLQTHFEANYTCTPITGKPKSTAGPPEKTEVGGQTGCGATRSQATPSHMQPTSAHHKPACKRQKAHTRPLPAALGTPEALSAEE
jgi:hypothetical protein